MDKKDLIKIAVALVTLAFLFEMFSISGAGRYLTGPEEGPAETPTPSNLLFGIAEANATVLAYPDNIIVVRGTGVGRDANLSARLLELQRGGKVSYYNSAEEGSVNVILAQGANITQVALNLTLDFPGYSLSSKAQISLPENLTFRTEAGNVTAPVRARPFLYMEPLVPAGGGIEVAVGATVGNGTASEVEVQVAEKEGIVRVPARVVALGEMWIVNATYAWEERAVNATRIQENLRAKYLNSTVGYEAASYIRIMNASEAQKERMRNLSYINFMVGDTALVESDFTNRSKVEEDVGAITGGNASVEFPGSGLFANITSRELDEGFLRGVIGGNATIRRIGMLELGRLVEIEGKQFIAPPGITLVRALPVNASLGDEVEQVARVRVKGARLLSAE